MRSGIQCKWTTRGRHIALNGNAHSVQRGPPQIRSETCLSFDRRPSFAQRLVYSQPIIPVYRGKVGEAVSSGLVSSDSHRLPDLQWVVAPDPVHVGRRQRTFRYPLSHDPMYAKLSAGEIVHQTVFTLHHQPDRLFTPSIDGRLRPSRYRSRICRDWCYRFCCCAAHRRPT
jgi:hypothetical protein